MSTIVTRAGKGSPLTNTEVDSNFTNLNTDKVEKSGDTLTGDLAFGDNVKAKFGASDDLQIYHDDVSNSSYIADEGGGRLRLRSNPGVTIQQAINTEKMAEFEGNGAVTLYYDNSLKLATTSSGVDVTGTLVADGFLGGTNVLRINSLEGSRGSIQISAPHLLTREVTYGNNFYLASDGTYTQDSAVIGGGLLQMTAPNADFGEFLFKSKQDPDSGGAVRDRLKIANTGDISFYDDAGTSQDFYWDASTSRLGIRNTAPTYDVDIIGDVNTDANLRIGHTDRTTTGQNSTFLRMATNARASDGVNRYSRYDFKMTPLNDFGNANLTLKYRNDGVDKPDVLNIKPSGDIEFFAQDGTTSDFYWDKSTSRLGLGTTSPDSLFHISSGGPKITITDTTYNADATITVNDAGSLTFSADANNERTNSRIQFDVDGSEAMRINSSGNVGIGTTSPAYNLEVRDSSNPTVAIIKSGVGGLYLDTNNSGTDAIMTITASSGLSGQADLAFKTGGNTPAEAMRIDSSGNVGIGTTSPSARLDASVTSTSDGIHVTRSAATRLKLLGDGTIKWGASANQGDLTWDTGLTIIKAESGNALAFKIGNSEAMRIDSSGRLGIGTTSPSSAYTGANNLVIGGGSAEAGLTIYSSTTTDGNIYFADGTASEGAAAYRGYLEYSHNSNYFRIGVNGSEAARIDSSGHMIVGGTTAGASTASTFYSSGTAQHRRSGSSALVADRLDSDGAIAEFRKDGTAVGSIGNAFSDNLYISGDSNHAGVAFGTNVIYPSTTTGAAADNEFDLGNSTSRFKGLYLSGGVYLGGTGSANLLDDYEEGTWFPDVSHATGFSTATVTSKDGRYTKIGRQVTLEFEFSLDSSTGNIVAGDDVVLTSNCLPFIPSFNGHAVGTFGCQLNMSTGEDIAMAYAGFAGTNVLGFIFHTVDGTVGRSNIMGGVVTYFTDA